MLNKNLTQEQKITRNILYSILAFTIFLCVFVDLYHLIDTKYRSLINFFMLGINGIVFYVGYKKQLVNQTSLIVSILLVATIVTIALINR
jgi:uncharacterized membrane protein